MAKSAVERRCITVKLACEAFRISQDCYRYVAKDCSQNDLIAQWLVALTDNSRDWGFGWNHKRSYRIYRELELNYGSNCASASCARSLRCWPCQMR